MSGVGGVAFTADSVEQKGRDTCFPERLHARTTPLTNLRKRLSPEASRDAALDAARALLVETGPQAVTLKAVSARIGRTHANVLHHFGSAEGFAEGADRADRGGYRPARSARRCSASGRVTRTRAR